MTEPWTLLGFPVVEVTESELLARALRHLDEVLTAAELAADRRRYNRARRKAVRAVLAGLSPAARDPSRRARGAS